MPLNKVALIANITGDINDNSSYEISAEDVRGNILDMVDTTFDIPGDATRSYSMTVTKGLSTVAALSVDGTLVISAGTTSQAPIVIASGTNLTTPIAGAIEFDGTNLYYTKSTGPTRTALASTTLYDAYVDWSGRCLENSSSDCVLNWESQELRNTSGNAVLDWQNQLLYHLDGSTAIDWEQCMAYDINTNISIDWTDRIIYDASGQSSIDWENRTAIDTNDIISLDWNSHLANDSTDTISIDWENRYITDTAGIQSIDWENRRAKDSVGNSSIDWEARTMYDVYAGTAITWNTGLVGIGLGTATKKLHIFATANSDGLKIQNTNDSAYGPVLEFYHKSTTPVVDDEIGTINFNGRDSSSNETTYAQIQGMLHTATNLNEKGQLRFKVSKSGVLTEVVRLHEDGNIGLGSTHPSTKVNIYTDKSADGLTVENINTGNYGALVDIYHNSANPTGNDEIAYVNMCGKTSSGDKVIYGQIKSLIQSPTSGSQAGQMIISNMKSGALTESFRINETATLALAAGDTTRAPLKFTSGSNLTTPVAGSMEFDGTNLYITQTSGPTRQTISLGASGTYAPTSRIINTTAPLTGGGNLSADLTLGIPSGSSSANGYLASGDWTTFNNKASTVSPAFTGIPTAPTASAGTNTTQIATTAFVSGENQSLLFDIYAVTDALEFSKMNIASPYFTGSMSGVSSAASGGLILQNTNSGNFGVLLDLYHNSANPTGNDVTGAINFTGKNSSGGTVNYGQIKQVIGSATSGSEIGELLFTTNIAGITTNRMAVGSGLLFDGGGNNSIDWTSRYLYDDSSQITVDWFYRELYNSAGGQNLSWYYQEGVTIGGGTTPATKLHVRSSTATDGITIENSNTGNSGALLDLFHNSSSPDANDVSATIKFTGKDSTGNTDTYSQLKHTIVSPTSGAEYGRVDLEIMNAGVMTNSITAKSDAVSLNCLSGYIDFSRAGSAIFRIPTFGSGPIVCNLNQGNYDFQSKGQTDANLLYVDASANSIGIGTATPSTKVHLVATTDTKISRLETDQTSNDSVIEDIIQLKQTTTDNTITYATIQTAASNYSYYIETDVIARRTAGGAAGDTCAYKLLGLFKDVAGTVTQVGTTVKTPVGESDAACDSDYNISGTAIRWSVTGITGVSYTWHATSRIRYLSS